MSPMNAFAPVQFPSSMDSGSIPSMPHNLEAEQALLGSLIYSLLGVLIESALGGLFAKK